MPIWQSHPRARRASRHIHARQLTALIRIDLVPVTQREHRETSPLSGYRLRLAR
jgi:hypothetical protein